MWLTGTITVRTSGEGSPLEMARGVLFFKHGEGVSILQTWRGRFYSSTCGMSLVFC